MIGADDLKKRLQYDPETGIFTWLASNNQVAEGGAAGTPDTSGHVQIKIAGRAYLAHRLAWLYVTGEWPEHQVDHRNRKPADNRWANLRAATQSENQRNKTGWAASGHRGVYWNRNNEKWQASIRVGGRNKSLGYYADKTDAVAARLRGEALHFGEFSALASLQPA